jgi:AAA15 family ATPase/GTPase
MIKTANILSDFMTSVYSLGQANQAHYEMLSQQEKLHRSEVELVKKLQEDEILLMKRTYLMNSFNDTERHFQQLNADLVQNSREFEKDMVCSNHMPENPFITI